MKTKANKTQQATSSPIESPTSSTYEVAIIPDTFVPLPLWRKLAYGFGGPPMQMVTNCVGFFLVIFLLETAGLNPFYNSVIQLTARVWDAITDPLMGYLVTKSKSRYGRFRPWLILSAPFGSLAFFLLFYVPGIESMVGKFLYYLAAILILQTAVTAFHVPYSSMTMVLTTNREERDSCSMYRMLFELTGVLIGAGVFGSVIVKYRFTGNTDGSHNETAGNETDILKNNERLGYMLASAPICCLFILCSVVAFFGTRELPVQTPKRENFFKSLRRILSFKPYLLLMFAFLFISLGIQTIQGNMTLYVTHSIHLPAHMTNGIIVLLSSAILLMPLVYLFMNRFGKKMAFTVGILNLYPILIVITYVPDQPPLWLFYGIMLWASVTISIAFLVPWSMLPDVIDDFMLKTGVRKEAVFYSLYVFFSKFAVGVAVSFSSAVLGFVGYKESQKVQEPQVGLVLRYLISASGMVCCTASLIFVYFYPINQTYLKTMRVNIGSLKPETREEQDPSQSSTTFSSTLDITASQSGGNGEIAANPQSTNGDATK